MGKNQHVVMIGKGWAVKGAADENTTNVTPNQKEVIVTSRKIACNQQSEAVFPG